MTVRELEWALARMPSEAEVVYGEPAEEFVSLRPPKMEKVWDRDETRTVVYLEPIGCIPRSGSYGGGS